MFNYKYNPLSSKDEIILGLSIIHSHTEEDTKKYMVDIRLNVAKKWEATLTEIDNLTRRRNEKYQLLNHQEETNVICQ
jgi:hypothetical protein